MSAEEKAPWEIKAALEKEEHARQNPDYKYQPSTAAQVADRNAQKAADKQARQAAAALKAQENAARKAAKVAKTEEKRRQDAVAAAARLEKKKRLNANGGPKVKGSRTRKTTTLSADISMASIVSTAQSVAASESLRVMAPPTFTDPRSTSTAPSSQLVTPPPLGNDWLNPPIVQQSLADQQQARLSGDDRGVTNRENGLNYRGYDMGYGQTMGGAFGFNVHNGPLCPSDFTGAAAHAYNGGPSTAANAPDSFGHNAELPNARTSVDEWVNSVGRSYSTHGTPMFDNGRAQPSMFSNDSEYGAGSAAGNGYNTSLGNSRSGRYEPDHYQDYPRMSSGNFSSRSTSMRDLTAASRWANAVSDDGPGYPTNNMGYASYGPEHASSSSQASNAPFPSQNADYNGLNGLGSRGGRGANFGLRPDSDFDPNFNRGPGIGDWNSDSVNSFAPTSSATQWQGEGSGAHDAL
ncbi:hypothetical protein BD626DRAFT_568783 [Schizophyllum amplum]|uniref:Uncharacterized protein n=1 Tax=Schizophyllum amplum TaxID=97359 RepID=A0A550CEZ1_9AGAR|nr:hypothetical protein BD626DRAFT_568783 [Auriculariopsis ampla]